MENVDIIGAEGAHRPSRAVLCPEEKKLWGETLQGWFLDKRQHLQIDTDGQGAEVVVSHSIDTGSSGGAQNWLTEESLS